MLVNLHRDTDLCDWFNAETDNGNDMTIYEMLLEGALESIRGEYIRKVNDQLDSRADAVLPTVNSQITAETEFELVTWLGGWSLGCMELFFV